MAKYRYEEHTWPELNEAAKAQKVVVIPVGTTEQHGHHLPLSVDCVTSGEMSRMAVERIPEAAILMPQIWYSFNEHHLDFPGTIAIQWQNIINYVVDVGKSVVHHGFRKILLVNGHGSNIPFLDISARLINNQTDANAALVSWWALAEPAITEIRESPFPGGMSHACELETSVLLHLRPDLVDMSKAVKDINFQPSRFIWWDLQRRSPVTFMEHFSRFSKTGVVGDPTLATADKGKRLVEVTVNNLVELIQEFREREIPQRVDHHGP